MKNTFMVIPLVFLCCFAVGCLQRGEVAEKPVADAEADIQAIKDIIEEGEAAINAGDINMESDVEQLVTAASRSKNSVRHISYPTSRTLDPVNV